MRKTGAAYNEQQLLARAREWDMQALELIYDRYSPMLYRYAVRLLGDPQVAEDCVAETFTRFLYGLRNGKGPQHHLKAYLFRIAHNWITDWYRRHQRGQTSLDAAEHDSTVPMSASSVNPEHHAITEWERDRLRRLLFQLTPEQRQVIVLRYLEGWSHAEIATVLQKPISAVKALQRRGLAALNRLMMAQEMQT